MSATKRALEKLSPIFPRFRKGALVAQRLFDKYITQRQLHRLQELLDAPRAFFEISEALERGLFERLNGETLQRSEIGEFLSLSPLVTDELIAVLLREKLLKKDGTSLTLSTFGARYLLSDAALSLREAITYRTLSYAQQLQGKQILATAKPIATDPQLHSSAFSRLSSNQIREQSLEGSKDNFLFAVSLALEEQFQSLNIKGALEFSPSQLSLVSQFARRQSNIHLHPRSESHGTKAPSVLPGSFRHVLIPFLSLSNKPEEFLQELFDDQSLTPQSSITLHFLDIDGDSLYRKLYLPAMAKCIDTEALLRERKLFPRERAELPYGLIHYQVHLSDKQRLAQLECTIAQGV